jgi:DNA mismatch endonuclease (patch repair protein)
MCYVKPTSNKRFWGEKIAANVARDKKVTAQLKKEDIHVVRFWEHEIIKNVDSCYHRLIRKLNQL